MDLAFPKPYCVHKRSRPHCVPPLLQRVLHAASGCLLWLTWLLPAWKLRPPPCHWQSALDLGICRAKAQPNADPAIVGLLRQQQPKPAGASFANGTTWGKGKRFTVSLSWAKWHFVRHSLLTQFCKQRVAYWMANMSPYSAPGRCSTQAPVSSSSVRRAPLASTLSTRPVGGLHSKLVAACCSDPKGHPAHSSRRSQRMRLQKCLDNMEGWVPGVS